MDKKRRMIRSNYMPQKMTGLVYFISAQDMMKIGYTENIDQRLSTLQTTSPFKLFVELLIKGNMTF